MIKRGCTLVHVPSGRVCTCLKVARKQRGVIVTAEYKERKKSNGIYLIYPVEEFNEVVADALQKE
jgi:hypothetical protein